MLIYCNIFIFVLKIIININLKQDNIKKLVTKLHLDNLCNSSKPISIPDGFSDTSAPTTPQR